LKALPSFYEDRRAKPYRTRHKLGASSVKLPSHTAIHLHGLLRGKLYFFYM
jgi:hypothetical protein